MRSHRSALHLLWTVPLAAALSILPLYWGTLAVCGVSGCDGGGFGPSYGPNYSWILAFTVVGGLLASAIVLVPWGRLKVRLVVGLTVGGIVSGYLVVHAWAMKYPVVT
ncbi:hypothetical protein ACN27E_18405 [Mycobacterium sp. WMMD1722]|uniref:hypothetical protein n=1 Tax=Mycobacterium sp. WMMD1722 TaxID=3404117 RepID=UPI003BF55700